MRSAEDDAVEVLSAGEERFENLRRRAGFFLAPVAFAIVYLLTAGRLSPEGSRLSAVLATVLVLWMTEALPLPVTAVLGASLCVVLGVADVRTIFGPFADPIVFLFIGSFMIARAMALHHLDRRFALSILSVRVVGPRPGRVLCAVGLATALLSMWLSNTATAAMMLPISLGILNALQHGGSPAGSADGGRHHGRPSLYATGMMLMVAYAASVGGVGTPVGSPPNLIGIGMLRKLAGVNISFFQWMAIGLPILLVAFAAMFGILFFLHRPRAHGHKLRSPAEFAAHLAQQRAALGGWSRGQVNTLVAFGLAIVLWIGPGVLAIILGKDHSFTKLADARLPESVVALIAASLLFALPVNWRRREFTLGWREAVRIDWGTILLFGGGLSLGGLMFTTGVAEAFGRMMTDLTGANSVWALTAVATAATTLITETTSNTAAANMMIPVIIALAQSAGINPVVPTLGACLGGSFAFTLPVSTPPNAVVYGSGLVPIAKMVRAGILVDVCGFFIILAGLRLLCPLLGLM